MSRISETFARLKAEGRTGLVAFATIGYPDVETSVALVHRLIDGGADVIELGVPFSDPIGEGTTIQRTSYHALQQGVTPWTVVEAARRLRGEGVTVPLILMGYYNPWLYAGLERYMDAAAAAGVDGFICVDLPPEEAHEMKALAAARGMDLIFLVAPTSSEERLAAVAEVASGFVYCVSVAGVTGARAELNADVPGLIARVRRHTDLPLGVGFGVSQREHVARIGELCEAAVIGSAIVNTYDSAPPEERLDRVREFVEVVTGRRGS
jgi:tryptophan synthase alpha chain